MYFRLRIDKRIISRLVIDILDSIKSNIWENQGIVLRPLWDIVIVSECDFGIKH